MISNHFPVQGSLEHYITGMIDNNYESSLVSYIWRCIGNYWFNTRLDCLNSDIEASLSVHIGGTIHFYKLLRQSNFLKNAKVRHKTCGCEKVAFPKRVMPCLLLLTPWDDFRALHQLVLHVDSSLPMEMFLQWIYLKHVKLNVSRGRLQHRKRIVNIFWNLNHRI